MFEKDAEEYVMREDVVTENNKVPFDNGYGYQTVDFEKEVKRAFKDGAEATLRKVIKYFSTRVLDENCGGYFSHLLESEEKLQELAKEIENV